MFSEIRRLGDFNSILLKGMGNVIVNKGSEQKVTVASDKNVLSNIRTRVKNKELVISLTAGLPIWLASFPKLDIHVTMKEVFALRVSGVGRIRTDKELATDKLILLNSGVGGMHLKLNCKEIKTYLKGVGEIELTGKTERHDVEISGTGKVDAYNLESKTSYVTAKGIGECIAYAVEDLFVDMSGIGRIKYRGNPEVHSKKTGLGNIERVP